MPKFKIKKAKLIKNDHMSLSYKITEDDGTEAKVSNDHDRPAHQDLKNCYNELAPHLAILTGCIKPKQVAELDMIKDFHVTGISFKDDEGFVITGYRTLDNGSVTLNTPFTRYEGENAYQLISKVEEVLQKCKLETLLYITEGKRAPEAQQEIDFPEENITNIQIAKPEPSLTTIGGKIPKADPEAMGRVAAMDKEKGKGKTAANKGAGKRRVKQTPENPSGLAED